LRRLVALVIVPWCLRAADSDVGAGIAGLALAASLQRFGITAVVAGIGDASLSRGLALMLTGNAAMALRRVGLDQIIVDRGIVLERIAHADPLGNPGR
jgi:2-polyprenyl-6-methoxyphenol hydroxylase-like FAD-dependent oxidoreductase